MDLTTYKAIPFIGKSRHGWKKKIVHFTKKNNYYQVGASMTLKRFMQAVSECACTKIALAQSASSTPNTRPSNWHELWASVELEMVDAIEFGLAPDAKPCDVLTKVYNRR